MSQTIETPPPPPPQPPSEAIATTTERNKINGCNINLPDNEYSWAVGYPELQKGCFFNRVCPLAPPKKCQYNDLECQLQVGPTCGLTALSMLLNGHPSAAELLVDAQHKKYTRNGEMFSAQYLFELTKNYLSSTTNCLLFEGNLNCNEIRDKLTCGSYLFVPYPF